MSDEEKVVTEEAGVQPDEAGKHPENVSWNQYVATKETIGGKLDSERTKSKELQEKLDAAVSSEDHAKVKEELDKANASLKEKLDASLGEKRATVVKSGLTEEKVNAMSEEALNAAIEVLGVKPNEPDKPNEPKPPGPDLGGGGGGSVPQGTPNQLAVAAYASSNR